MSLELYILNANDSLANLELAINQTEQLGFELISLAKGFVSKQPANMATFKRLTPGTSPAGGVANLVEEPPESQLSQQEDDLNAREADGKKLISYAALYVKGNETNVAVFRG
jgi:hypothetical protein